MNCFRGSEEDVLNRYYQCVCQFGGDIIVRVTSDCPLLEPKLIDFWVGKMLEDKIR